MKKFLIELTILAAAVIVVDLAVMLFGLENVVICSFAIVIKDYIIKDSEKI